jgi:succinyl-CoA synthetase alpha subunit
MSILVDSATRVIFQGITGRQGSFHAERALATGTRVVAGVRMGKGGTSHLGIPVFDRVRDAVSETGATASVIFVPPANAADAIEEAINAGIGLVVCVTERIPILDMVRVRSQLKSSNTLLVGPNTPGIAVPGQCTLGIMPQGIFLAGRVGIVSRSSTLTYEAVEQTTRNGLGQSTCVGIGADPVFGLSFVDCMERFNADPQTDGIILIGEVGGSSEETAAAYLADIEDSKPVVAYIAGQSVPVGRRIGHAGTIMHYGTGTAKSKMNALACAGATIVRSPVQIGEQMASLIDNGL